MILLLEIIEESAKYEFFACSYSYNVLENVRAWYASSVFIPLWSRNVRRNVKIKRNDITKDFLNRLFFFFMNVYWKKLIDIIFGQLWKLVRKKNEFVYLDLILIIKRREREERERDREKDRNKNSMRSSKSFLKVFLEHRIIFLT